MIVALVRDNVVVDVIEADTEQLDRLMTEYQNVVNVENMVPVPAAGWAFDGAGFAPMKNVDGSPSMVITKLAFRNRFTMTEKATLYGAAELRPQGLPLKVYIDDVAAATFIDLARQDTKDSVNYLAYLGLITAERANQILTTPPTGIEIYR